MRLLIIVLSLVRYTYNPTIHSEAYDETIVLRRENFIIYVKSFKNEVLLSLIFEDAFVLKAALERGELCVAFSSQLSETFKQYRLNIKCCRQQ